MKTTKKTSTKKTSTKKTSIAALVDRVAKDHIAWANMTDAERAEHTLLAMQLAEQPDGAELLAEAQKQYSRQRANLKRMLIAQIPTVFVVGHERKKLRSIAAASHVRKVYLPDLKQDMRLAENQIYRSDLLLRCESEYIGLASASWNTKYDGQTEWHGRHWPHCVPIDDLYLLDFTPNVVWSAARTDDVAWSEGLDCIFNGIHPLVNEIVEHFGLRHHHRIGPLANNYIAHRSVVQALTRFMRAAMEYLDQKYSRQWPLQPERSGLFTDRLPAFMGEALSILFFVQQTDLEIRQIPKP
jgi:hypothetical protein